MKRHEIAPRKDWQTKVEELGFGWHTLDGAPYWTDGAYYEFTSAEIDTLDEAAVELHGMALAACDRIVDHRLYGLLGIDPETAKLIEWSWKRFKDGKGEIPLYGRFDLSYDGTNPPKMLEYNADTPTSLLETAIVQYDWLKERFPDADQFNSLHEGLLERWGDVLRLHRKLTTDESRFAPGETREALHVACIKPHMEDEGNLAYLFSNAIEAGLRVKHLGMQDIGLREDRNPAGRLVNRIFTDLEDAEITCLFKLYPWEWMIREPFGRALAEAVMAGKITVLEPAWKMMLSNKGLAAILWEMFPYHPNLLETHFDPSKFAPGSMVAVKPLLGREGANVTIGKLGAGGRADGAPIAQTAGSYGDEGFVTQAYHPIAQFKDDKGKTHHAVLGAWMIGDACRGLGIREDDGPVTRDTSRYVPHIFR